MPPLPDAPGVMKFAFDGNTTSSSLWSVIIHWAYTGSPPDESDATDTATYAYNEFTQIMTNVTSDFTLTQCTMTPLDNNMTNVGTYVHATQGGLAEEGTMTAQTAVLVNYTIAARWRGGRPRSFMPPMGAAQLNNTSYWHSEDLANYQDNLTTFFSNLQGHNQGAITLGLPGCLSYISGGEPRTPPVFYPFTGMEASINIGSMRRRRFSVTY